MKPSPLSHRWLVAPPGEESTAQALAAAGFPLLTARLLSARGITTPEAARAFLHPPLSPGFEPFLLKDLERAAVRILEALRNREGIMIFGDYDVDGVTATVLLHRVLSMLGGKVSFYLPNRFTEGYGLSTEGMDEAKRRGAKVVLSVDCGTAAHQEALYAKSLGLDLIVTDHHEMGDHPLPDAYAVVNPKRPDCASPDKNLAAAGVAFKVAWALLRLCKRKVPLESLYRIACLGTIADIVPLVGENRTIARYGLDALQGASNHGLRELIAVAGLSGKPITAGHVGFFLGPRLNAAGRLEHASKAVDLFLVEKRDQAQILALWLDAENKKRQAIQERMVQEARLWVEGHVDLSQAAAIIVHGTTWNRGVVGIVAGKLKELYHRPTFAISIEEGAGTGSGRSIPGFNLYEAVAKVEKHLSRWGGHAMAAGLTVPEENLSAFVQDFEAVCRESLNPTELRPEVKVDLEAPLAEITSEAEASLRQMAPFGSGNPEPVVLIRNLRNLREPSVIKEAHLKFEVVDEGRTACLPVIFWRGKGIWEAAKLDGKPFDLACKIGRDDWNGRNALQLTAVNVRPSS